MDVRRIWINVCFRLLCVSSKGQSVRIFIFIVCSDDRSVMRYEIEMMAMKDARRCKGGGGWWLRRRRRRKRRTEV
jgi:hypothetical protein